MVLQTDGHRRGDASPGIMRPHVLVGVLLLLACASADDITLQSVRRLNDGNLIPLYGLGTYQADSQEAYKAVLAALQMGYRHFDTATRYHNEEAVGRAIRDSGIPREQLFITTKVYNDDQGYETTIAALQLSLEKLGFDYVDLYLIHAPVPGKRLDTWRAMEYVQRQGMAKSIGVSNYNIAHIKEIMDQFDVVPAVNQLEIHPWLIRDDVIVFCEEHDIAVEGYSPLAKASRFGDTDLITIAASHGKTEAQVLLRWALQHNFITIPKSSKPKRIQENADVFDFKLTHEEMAVLNAKHEGFATGWNPVEDPAYA